MSAMECGYDDIFSVASLIMGINIFIKCDLTAIASERDVSLKEYGTFIVLSASSRDICI